MEMEVSLIITHIDYRLFIAFQGVRKTKCDVQYTERVYCPVFTILKFNTSIRTKEKDLVSFAILPLHTIIISYMSPPSSGRKQIKEMYKYSHILSLRNAVQAHTKDSNMLNTE